MIQRIRLSDNCYEPRTTSGGGEVRDLILVDEGNPVAYVTDGFHFGIEYDDGHIDWLGATLNRAFGDDAEIVEYL